MEHKERLLETVIIGLLKEIQLSVDNGKVSSEILEGDIWVDTKDHKQSINIDLDWSKENVALTATAFPIKHLDNGSLQEDCTGQEELFLDLTTKEEVCDTFQVHPENINQIVSQSMLWLNEIKDRDDDEQYSMGFEVGEGDKKQILDINIFDGDILCGNDGKWHCELIECHTDAEGCHARGNKYLSLWSIDKNENK